MKYILILILLSGCMIQKPNESFYYNNEEIYHISQQSDTTLLSYSDIRVLKIDSLRKKYIEFKAER